MILSPKNRTILTLFLVTILFLLMIPNSASAQGTCAWNECAAAFTDLCDPLYGPTIATFIGYAWCPGPALLSADYTCSCVPSGTSTPTPTPSGSPTPTPNPVSCPLTAQSGRTIYEWPDPANNSIRADMTNAEATAGPYPFSLSAGIYDVTLVSYGDHSSEPTESEEFWKVRLTDISDQVDSEPISDLPDGVDWRTEQVNSQLNVPFNTDEILAFHEAFYIPSANDIHPVCAAFDLVPDLSVDLISDVYTGTSPLMATLEAAVGGTETGSMNYSFWWNCNDPTTDVATANAACGTLITPPPGSCFPTPGVGLKCDGWGLNPQSAPNMYFPDGTYTPKVIVERGASSPVEDRATITVNSNTPPVAFNTTSTLPVDFCIYPKGVTIGWDYFDAEWDDQLKFQIQADDTGDFSSPEFVSAEITSDVTTHFVDDNDFDYNELQYARVKVWDVQGNPSEWSPSTNWTTRLYAPPVLSVSWLPNPAIIDTDVIFTNNTTYTIMPAFIWNFGCNAPLECDVDVYVGLTPPTQQYHVLPVSVPPPSQDYFELVLSATDGYYVCEETYEVYVNPIATPITVPTWTEVGP